MSELIRQNNFTLSYTWNKGSNNICILYLHGWSAQHRSHKGDAISEVAKQLDCHYLSLDYTGHGKSSGKLADFSVKQGVQDVCNIINETIKTMPLIIIGASIGGWIGLILSERLPNVKSYIGLAPAPDITGYIWDKLIPDYAKPLIEQGEIIGPSQETRGFCFTKKFFEDGKSYFMLDRPIKFIGPVRLLLGDQDEYIDIERLYRLKDRLLSDDITLTLIKGANHHLSTPRDLKKIQNVLIEVFKEVHT